MRKRLWVPLIIFFMAFLLRYSLIELSEVGTDETIYIHAGIEYIKNLYHLETRWDYWTFNCEHPPLAKYIIGIILLPFYIPDEKIGWPARWIYVLPVRLTWALIGSLMVVIVYFLGKEYKGFKLGLLASMFMLFNPLSLFYAINGYQLEPLMVLFGTVAQLVLYRGIIQKKYSYFLCSAILFGLSLSTNYLALPIIFGSIVWTLYMKTRNSNILDASRKILVRELLLQALFLTIIFLTFTLLWGLWLIPNGIIRCLIYSIEKVHRKRLPLIFEHRVHLSWKPIQSILWGTPFGQGWRVFEELGNPLLNYMFYPWESLTIVVGLIILAKKTYRKELTDFEYLILFSFLIGIGGLSSIPEFLPQWLLYLTPYTSLFCSITISETYHKSKHMLSDLFQDS